MPSEELRRFVEGKEGREGETTLDRKAGALVTREVLPPSLPLPPLISLDMGSCVEVGLRTAGEWEELIEGVVRALKRLFPSKGRGGEGGEGSSSNGSDGFRLLLLHFPPRPALTAVKGEEGPEADGGERKKRRLDEQQQHSKNILRLSLEEYVPHSWLFPRCHLVLHHGGLGSTLACLGGGRGGGGGGGGGNEGKSGKYNQMKINTQ